MRSLEQQMSDSSGLAQQLSVRRNDYYVLSDMKTEATRTGGKKHFRTWQIFSGFRVANNSLTNSYFYYGWKKELVAAFTRTHGVLLL